MSSSYCEVIRVVLPILFGGNINDADFYTGAYSRIHNDYASREGIDWQDEVFGSTGITQNHNVNITGGN